MSAASGVATAIPCVIVPPVSASAVAVTVKRALLIPE